MTINEKIHTTLDMKDVALLTSALFILIDAHKKVESDQTDIIKHANRLMNRLGLELGAYPQEDHTTIKDVVAWEVLKKLIFSDDEDEVFVAVKQAANNKNEALQWALTEGRDIVDLQSIARKDKFNYRKMHMNTIGSDDYKESMGRIYQKLQTLEKKYKQIVLFMDTLRETVL